jgi:CRISPR/Cas system CMR-associated protein Cmr5 small subunit
LFTCSSYAPELKKIIFRNSLKVVHAFIQSSIEDGVKLAYKPESIAAKITRFDALKFFPHEFERQIF